MGNKCNMFQRFAFTFRPLGRLNHFSGPLIQIHSFSHQIQSVLPANFHLKLHHVSDQRFSSSPNRLDDAFDCVRLLHPPKERRLPALFRSRNSLAAFRITFGLFPTFARNLSKAFAFRLLKDKDS